MRVIVDTNVLMNGLDFKKFEKVVVPIVCVEELDKLKMDKDMTRSYEARNAIRELEKASNVVFKLNSSYSLPLSFSKESNDNSILKFAKDSIISEEADLFYTRDLNFKLKAKAMEIPLYVDETECSSDRVYKGYKEITMTEQEIADHYTRKDNYLNLLINEYLIIYNEDNSFVDTVKWTEKGYQTVVSKNIGGKKRGEIDKIETLKPYDSYQVCAIDSINSNDFTILTGKAGSGKTLISISWLINALDSSNQKITKVIIVYNNAPLKGAQKQGFYPGSRTEKALQSNVGSILASKLGGMDAVEQLIKQEKIELVPASDIRGIEVNPSQALFITEAQNMDAYVLKTAVQRAKLGAKIIVEGDILEQRDIICPFEETGMFRAMEVFKGTPYFGCVKLKTNYRNPIADIADKM